MTATPVALPSSRVSVLAEQVRALHEERRALRVVGAGTWLSAGPPIVASETVSVAEHREIIEYVPGDLTITVGAGVSLGDIADATRPHNQWLTLDPFGDATGTIGATIATASSGPLATAFGTPRDLVLGIEAISGTGNIIRAGGRVVKNVAGFDLSRLFIGSWGTLGVVTEVTLRLRARPEHDVTVSVSIEDTVEGMQAVVRALRAWPFTPMAAEVVDGGCAAAVGLGRVPTLLLRLGGNTRAIASQRQRARALGKVADADGSAWDKLRGVERGSTSVIRMSSLPSAFPEQWGAAQQLAGKDGVVLGSPARGTIRCVLGELEIGRIAAFRGRWKNWTMAFETLPTAEAWEKLTTAVDSDSLDGRVRAAFDPAGIMNTGVMRRAR